MVTVLHVIIVLRFKLALNVNQSIKSNLRHVRLLPYLTMFSIHVYLIH